MLNKEQKPARDELIAMLPTQGWQLKGHTESNVRTLEDVVRAAHQKHSAGEPPGIVSRIENEIEVDMLQLQELWLYLGLPT